MNAKEYYGYLEDARRKQDAIKHYGTKGQKWGVRHWQYPDGRFTDEGKARYFGSGKSRDSVDYENGPAKYDSAEALAILALYVAPTALYVGGSAIHDAAISHNIKKYEKHRLKEQTDPETGLKLKDNPDATVKEDMKDVNMEYRYALFHSSDRNGRTQNCMLCTTALDLKRRGYDVKAGTASDGFTDDALKKWYKNPKIQKDRLDDIIRTLKKEPEGSYGNFMCIWKMGGGHSMFYRIEDGKVAIYDAQSGKYYKDITKSSLITEMWGGSNQYNGTAFCRTDNLKINIKYLKEKEYIV